jgi:hypothetical protein
MINLFIYILKYPTLASVAADIQLLDVVAGYFCYLEFSTASRLTYPITKDIARWARTVAERARRPHDLSQGLFPAASTMDTTINATTKDIFSQVCFPLKCSHLPGIVDLVIVILQLSDTLFSSTIWIISTQAQWTGRASWDPFRNIRCP